METTKKTTTTKATTAKKTTMRKKAEAVSHHNETPIYSIVSNTLPSEVHHIDVCDGVSIDVSNRIGFTKMASLVQQIIDTCVDGEKYEVHWEIADYVIKASIFSAYCGIDAPEDVEDGYNSICCHGGLYDRIEPLVDKRQIDEIWRSVYDKLHAREDLNNSTAAKRLGELLDNVGELMNMVSSVSEDVSNEDATELIGRLNLLGIGK